MVQFYGSIFNEATANTGVACPSHSRAMLRLGGRHAPVSPFSLHGPADVVQPAPSFATNSFSSADSPLSRWFSDQLAEVAASAHLDQHAQPSHQQQQQPLQHLPRSLSSKQFSARYGRWADGVIEDMMTSPGSLADRSNSSSLRCASRYLYDARKPGACAPRAWSSMLSVNVPTQSDGIGLCCGSVVPH